MDESKATEKTMEDAEEVTAATADPVVLGQSKRRVKVALTRYLLYTGRCSKGMWQHRGTTEETTEAVEEAAAATVDLATTQAKGASIRPLACSRQIWQDRWQVCQARVSGAAKVDRYADASQGMHATLAQVSWSEMVCTFFPWQLYFLRLCTCVLIDPIFPFIFASHLLRFHSLVRTIWSWSN